MYTNIELGLNSNVRSALKSNSFYANFVLGYELNRYLDLEGNIRYKYYNADKFTESIYSIAIHIIAKFFKDSLFSPFIGFGPGFDK